MQGKTEAIREYGSKVTDSAITRTMAREMSNKLLQEIKAGNVTTVNGLITKDPIDTDKYVVPVRQVHITAARGVEGSDIALTPANQMVGLLEKVYAENKGKTVQYSIQTGQPTLATAQSQYR